MTHPSLCPDSTGAGHATALTDGLSEREEVVIRHIALGYSNKEISARLTLSVKTVETYKARALDKLGLLSRVELVRYASARGWYENLGPPVQRRTSDVVPLTDVDPMT